MKQQVITYKTAIILVSLALSFLSHPLHAQKIGINYLHKKGDTILLNTNKDLRGQIQWQISGDGQNWEDLAFPKEDSIYYQLDSTAFYRAKVMETNCLPVFSDTTKIRVAGDQADTLNICDPETLDIRINNYLYGTVSWERSENGADWERIKSEHDTTLSIAPEEPGCYRAVGKFPSTSPIYTEIIHVKKPPHVNGGPDRIINGNTVQLMADMGEESKGVWSVQSGTGGGFLDEYQPQTQFTGTDTSYSLIWKVSNDCGSSSDTVNIKFVDNQYIETLAIVDTTDNLLSNSSQLDRGLYIIDFSDPEPVITDTTVMLGLIGDGFIRKVDSFFVEQDTFSIYTSQGTLADITISGAYDLGRSFSLDTNAAKSSGIKRLYEFPTRKSLSTKSKFDDGIYYYIIENEPVYTYPGVKYSAQPIKGGGKEVKLAFNNTIFSGSNIHLDLNGYYAFRPNFIAELDYKWLKVRSFRMGMYNGEIERDYQLQLTAGASADILDKKYTLFSYSKNIIFVISGVPVWIKAQFDINGNISINASGSMNLTHHYNKLSTYTAALELQNNKLNSKYRKTQRITTDNSFDIQGDLTQTFSIGPAIVFKIYGIVGPYIDTKLLEELNLCLYNSNWQSHLDLGGQITVGAKAEALGATLFDLNKSFRQGFYNLTLPSNIEMISGNKQTYQPGMSMGKNVKVRVGSNKSYVVPGVPVKFEPQNNDSVVSSIVFTDRNGEASVSWIPGGDSESKLKAYVLDCQGNHISGSPKIFHAYSESSTPGNYDCGLSSLYATVDIDDGIISPRGHMGNPPYLYSLNGNDYTSNAPEINPVSGEHYDFYLKDQYGCLATASYTAADNVCEDSDLALETFVLGNTVELSASGGAESYQFSIDNPDGGFSSSYIYKDLSVGEHHAYVKDEQGCVASEKIEINDDTSPIHADFKADDRVVMVGETVHFTDESTNNPTSWLWDFGDGTASTNQNPSHSYSSSGKYTVKLSVANEYGADSLTKPGLITVNNENQEASVALLVVDKSNLNSYDNGFIEVFNSIVNQYTLIDLSDISNENYTLTNFDVVVSNIMGYGDVAPDHFSSIKQELTESLNSGTEYIVGSESVALLEVMELASGSMTSTWSPALNDTRAFTTDVANDLFTENITLLPNYEDYLGQDGSMLSSYFGDGVFWKVINNFYGQRYRIIDYTNYQPIHRLLSIWSGFSVSSYQTPRFPLEYVYNGARICELGRFWTTDNETPSKGWIGPEGIQVLMNAINSYSSTSYQADNPGNIDACFYDEIAGETIIHWDRVENADYYEIWQSPDATSWRPIGLIPQDASQNYDWTSPLTDSRNYRIRCVLDDTPGSFSDIPAQK